MDILVSALEERLPSLARAVVLLSIYGCEPCVAIRAAMQNVRPGRPDIEFLVAYFDRRNEADRAFLERASVAAFPTVWFVDAGKTLDLSASIRRATPAQARADLESQLGRWTNA